MRTVLSYLGCLAVLFALDMVWLQTMNARLYQPAIGELLAENPNIAAIAVFYLVYVGGVVYFAIAPSTTWTDALLRGALFGFFCYATYDLTNMATLRVWSLPLTLIDIAWGTFLTGTASVAGFLIGRLMR